jgi:hypothetical protein
MTRPSKTFRVELVATTVLAIHLRADDPLDVRGMAESLWRDELQPTYRSGFEILHDAVQATNVQEVLL